MKNIFKVVLLGAVAVIFLAILMPQLAARKARRNHAQEIVKVGANASAPTHQQQNTETPVINVTSRKLYSDYKANEVKADGKYKGKQLKVVGSIGSIEKDPFDRVFVGLRAENPYLPIHAYVANDQIEKAKGLDKGQKITVLCEGAGVLLTTPVLQDCVIQDVK